MTLQVKTSNSVYKINIERGLLHRASDLFNLNRKVLIVTDTGVPEQYAMTIASQCAETVLFVFEQGEPSKNMDTFIGILQTLTENAFSRTDCIVAVGGGVVGDMAGFAASTYMRGIDFYNVPTTVLSQIDSSVGGKTAVDFMGYKNLIGTFYPPKGVLIDPLVLNTLPDRQINNGLAEAVKVALTHDAQLFTLLESEELTDVVMDEIIYRAISVKKQVVEQDEHESNLRKVLNFGHTLGHGIESVSGLYHGECVAIGMIPMASKDVQERLRLLLQKLSLPIRIKCDVEAVIEACRHDKKASGNTVTVIIVPEIGQFEMKTMDYSEFEMLAREVLN